MLRTPGLRQGVPAGQRLSHVGDGSAAKVACLTNMRDRPILSGGGALNEDAWCSAAWVPPTVRHRSCPGKPGPPMTSVARDAVEVNRRLWSTAFSGPVAREASEHAAECTTRAYVHKRVRPRMSSVRQQRFATRHLSAYDRNASPGLQDRTSRHVADQPRGSQWTARWAVWSGAGP
jgi:hypothetical protein